MLQIEEVIERLKDILSKEQEGKVYDKDVAKALGISPEYLSILKKRKKIPFKEILDFCAKRQININWLLYDQDPHSLCDATDRFIYVRYFKEIHGSAGGGAFNYESESEKLYIDEHIANILGGPKRIRHIEAINVLGDSMEPELKEGSIVFVDTLAKDIKKSGIFLISTNAGLFIKRVRLRTDNKIELISSNASYPVEIVQPDEMIVVGKVVGVVERF